MRDDRQQPTIEDEPRTEFSRKVTRTTDQSTRAPSTRNRLRRTRSQRTRRLSEAIATLLPERPFELVLWDRTRVPATDSGPTITVHSPRALGHLLRARGQLGVVRAYVDGSIDVDDLDAAVLLGGWSPPALPRAARARLLASAFAAAGSGVRLPSPPVAEMRPRGRLHSQARDARSVRHHYDLPGEFFSLFLDSSMTYSCALFRDGAQTLDAAQEAKHELVCRKLDLHPGQRVLDLGCGWGAFALHAAARHGVHVTGITLSPPQAEIARSRAAGAGLEDRVDIRVMDYRDLRDERFDAVCSVGMVEHVGNARLDGYARTIASVLAPGGRLLNHGIARLPAGVHHPTPFAQRYVFPDGELTKVSGVIAALERAGFEPHHLEDLRADYAETLRHWIRRLDMNAERAEKVAGPESLRVFQLYLRGARHGFDIGLTSVFQVLTTLRADAARRGHQEITGVTAAGPRASGRSRRSALTSGQLDAGTRRAC
jgi:cyclopropane-fatty-acyl-phospholipid synthase